MNDINLNSFLKFGYFLDYNNPEIKFDFSGINKWKYENVSENRLINIGTEILQNVIDDNFDKNKGHVVPLSGGLDSRAILGGLLKCTEAKNIHTYTFGTPGTLDYDIGNYIAKKVGTIHRSYPLTEYRYSLEEELIFSSNIEHQSILFHHAPVNDLIKSYDDFVLWSGFMGDPIAGSHLLKKPSITNEEAISKFINKNTFVKSCDLTNKNEANNVLNNYLCLSSNSTDFPVSLDEIYDFNFRQLRYVAPHVLIKGYNYKLPFVGKEWFDFMMSVPNNYRYNQYLYNKILVNSFPILFGYKTKHNGGVPLQASRVRVKTQKGINYLKRKSGLFVDPNINYIDFATGIRERMDLKDLIYSCINDLKKRNILDWVDIDQLWKNHINKKANHADALITLASLEIHLKAGKKV